MADLVSELDLPEFDMTDADLSGDAYHERLAAVRELGWLVRSPIAFVVLDREAGEFFLRARQTAFPGREIAELFGIAGGRLAEQIDANILNLTGDRHRRLRALVAPAFTPRSAARWRPVMREIASALWRELADRTECDFVSWFAGPFPARTIAAVIGAPHQDAATLHEWSSLVQRQFDIRALAADPERIEQAVCELYDYVADLLDRRRGEPANDLISALLRAEADGERLTGPECVNLVLNVLAGGVDTTSAQLARPAAVRHAPGPVGGAAAAAGARDQGRRRGAQVRAAERAKRESASGEDFDITADPAGDRVLTFGAGPHFCLGQNLARAEPEEALGFLAPRLPGLRPDRPGSLDRRRLRVVEHAAGPAVDAHYALVAVHARAF
jgi:cytochrome P450